MLQPKRTKYRKMQKSRNRGLRYVVEQGQLRRVRPEGDHARPPDRAPDRSGASLHHALRQARRQAVDPRVPGQADLARSPSKFVWATARATSSSGSPSVQPGRMLYEIEGVTEAEAREAFRLAAAKLSVQTQFVTRTVL